MTPEEMNVVQRGSAPGLAVSAWIRALVLEAAERGAACDPRRSTSSMDDVAHAKDRTGPLRNSAEVAAVVRGHITDREKEHFLAVLLDAKHRVKRAELVSVGTLTASLVHPREVFRPAIAAAAAAVILVHNHPSGDPAPSSEDIQLTRRLREVGDLIGIRVLDHVIVGAESHFSFVDAGQW